MTATWRRIRTCFLASSLGLCAAVPSTAQDGDVSFTEVIDVRVVNVEVVVEDSKGRRVAGLEADDFRLLVDGRRVDIEHFTELRKGRPAGGGAVPQSNSYVIYIDDYFAIGAHRDLILDNLARQLGRLEAPSQAAVVAFSGRSLDLLADWTSSQKELRQAIEAAKLRPAWGLMRFSERQRQGISVIPAAMGDFFTGEGEYELRREVDALVTTMRRFAAADGRKILLVLSGGWPSIDTSAYTRLSFDDRQENDLDILRPVSETANLLGFTLYPVDVPGLRFADPDAVRRSRGEFDLSWREIAGDRSEGTLVIPTSNSDPEFVYGQPWDSFFGPRRFEDRARPTHREMLRQSTLRVVARDTGGRALLGSERARALPEVIEDASSYYWLSFTPQREFDDDLHRIRVEVGDGRYRVRSRRNFRDLSMSTQISMATLGAALMTSAMEVDEMDLALGSFVAAGRRDVQVPVTVTIPADRITVLPADAGYVANLELRLAAVDDAGRHSEVPLIPVRLSFVTPPTPHETVTFETKVKLRKSSRRLVASLFDPLGGRVMLARVELER